MKVCIKCSIEKDISEFPSYKKRSGIGVKNECRLCKNRRAMESLKASPERVLRKKAGEKGRVRANEKEIVARYRASDKGKKKAADDAAMRKEHTLQVYKGRYCAITPICCPSCKCNTVVGQDLDLLPDYRRLCNQCRRGCKGMAMPRFARHCDDCGAGYVGVNNSRRCDACSEARSKEQERLSRNRRGHGIADRARRHGVHTEAVNRAKVYARDKYRCAYCKCKVKSNDSMRNDMATLDHVIPLHIGGEHTYSNVVTACFGCNSSKSGSIIEGSQVSLFTIVREDRIGIGTGGG